MGTLTRKGWSQPTLDALGVTRDGDRRWTIPTEAGALRYADDGRKPKMLAANGTSRALWPSPETVKGAILLVVEGEPDAISATELGYPTVGLPGAGKFDPSWPARLVTGRSRVVLVGDCDEVGRGRMRSVAEQVTKFGGNAYLIDLAPDRSDGYDLGDLLVEVGPMQARGVLDAAIVGATLFAPDVPEAPKPAGAALFTTRGIDLTQLRPVRFAWKPWLIHGRLNLFAGEESSGKSTLQAWLAAKVTRGELPGEFENNPGSVLYVGADEDDWNEIVAPRLYAVGADLDRVREFVPLVDTTVFNAVDHIAELDRELRTQPFALVVFEQLMDVLPKLHNPNDPMEVRHALRPLRRVLAARDVTGLGTLHVNKAVADQLRQRMQGSMQFGALSRSTVLVDRHPTEEDRRIAVLGKANYVAHPVAISFLIESHEFNLNGADFNLGIVGDVRDDDATVEDVLARGRGETLITEHREDVLDALSDVPVSERALAGRFGIAKTTIHRILEELKSDDLACPTSRGWVRSIGLVPYRETDRGPGQNGDVVQGPFPYRGPDRGPALDEYRKWESRRLGEREDEDDD